MGREEILERINEIFQEVFDDEEIEVFEDTTADDIEEWDSIRHLSLISEIEGEYGFKFQAKDIAGMKNVGEMIDIILENI